MKRGQVSNGIITTLLLGVVAVAAFVVAWSGLVSTTADNYNFTANTTNYDALNKATAISNLTYQAQNEFSGSNSSGTSEQEIGSVVTTAGFRAARIFSSTPSLYASIITSAANTIGIPSTYISLAIVAIIIVFIGLFVYLALGRR